MLKKLITALLVCALFLGLAACSAPQNVPEPQDLDPSEPLTICFDLDNPWDPRHYELTDGAPVYSGVKLRQQAVDGFLQAMKEAGGPEDVQVEFLEGYGSDREGQLTRLRAELMAGKGPDLFVLRQNGLSDLFLFPEKKMDGGLFLALDRYMDGAQFMEPDKMLAPVFNAGLSDDGRRFLLPMSFDIDAVVLPPPSPDYDPEKPLTFDGMLDGNVLALWKPGPGEPFTDMSPALGRLANYKKESLLFTEEELGEFFSRLLSYEQAVDSGDIEPARGMFMGDLVSLEGSIASRSWAMEPVALVPLYDREGGVSARVDFFMGINTNAGNPAGAFWAADFLLGHDYMGSSDLHMYMWNGTMPIYPDLLGPEAGVPYIRDSSGENISLNGFSSRHWDAVQELFGRVTQARFPSELDTELTRAYWEYYSAEDEHARNKAVSQAYSTMRMMLGES